MCEFLSEAEIAAAYAQYEALMGAGEKPAYDEDPTQDQLSAISHLLKLGLNLYVDFGMFGPTDRESRKRSNLQGSSSTPTER